VTLAAFRAGHAAPDDRETFREEIVGVTSATPLRAISGLSVYSGARGAQNAFVQVVGNEVAAHNVQFNAIGPVHIANNILHLRDVGGCGGERAVRVGDSRRANW
jgi:NAD(P)-dependent dehydrogenase (short-subunit alcohol dehydrogenase family)